MTDYSYIHPEFRYVMSLSDQERIDFINQPRWLGYEAANQILATLNQLIEQDVNPITACCFAAALGFVDQRLRADAPVVRLAQ